MNHTTTQAATCTCHELVLSVKGGESRKLHNPQYDGAYHSCSEVRRRNQFIPLAEEYAMTVAGDPKSPNYGDRFTRAFSMEMDRMCARK